MESVEYQVVGMTCGHCEGRVAHAVSALPGVVEVSADAGTGRVAVRSEHPLDPGQVEAAVEDAGYELARS